MLDKEGTRLICPSSLSMGYMVLMVDKQGRYAMIQVYSRESGTRQTLIYYNQSILTEPTFHVFKFLIQNISYLQSSCLIDTIFVGYFCSYYFHKKYKDLVDTFITKHLLHFKTFSVIFV